MLVVSGIDALIILAYWRWSGADLGAAFRIDRKVLGWCALAPLALLVALPIDYGYHHLLRSFFGVHREIGDSLVEPFASAGYGLGIQLFSIAIMPGVWEELAFRGLIMGQLQRSVGAREAIVLSSLLFGIIHLAWFSLPYLVGIGLILALLRQRSGSLVPGMMLHAAHNGVIVLLVRWG
jgi:membrane protease YdiL (CAAX protease family)